MSLLDEFDDVDPGGFTSGFSNPSADELYDGFVTAPKVEEEQPMFALERVNFKVNGIIHMVACNHQIVLALKNGHLMRFDDQDGSSMEDIEITRRAEDRIHKLFLDPSGTHLVIAMENDESYYLNKSWKKPKPVPKFKGVVIDAIAWDRSGGVSAAEPGSTREMLVGTSRGRLYETQLDVNERAFLEGPAALLLGATGGRGGRAAEAPFKQLHQLPEQRPLVGLRYERFAAVGGPHETRKYFVMAATASRLYQFIGGPTFEACFAHYEAAPTPFQEIPGPLPKSELCFFSKYQLPKSFAWLTGEGILYGQLIFGSQNAGDSVTSDVVLLSYPPPPPAAPPAANSAAASSMLMAGGKQPAAGASASTAMDQQQQQQQARPPLGLAMTEFHLILLYDERIVAVSPLDQSVVWTHPVQPRQTGPVRGFAHDTAAEGTTGIVWLYCESSVHELIVTAEGRNVWRLYLQQQQFDLALQQCQTAAQRDQVWTAQAEHYMQSGRHKLAGTYFGKTQRPLEDVALRFISLGEREALQNYLETRLDTMRQAGGAQREPTQMTLLATWLTEIYLDNLSLAGRQQQPPKQPQGRLPSSSSSSSSSSAGATTGGTASAAAAGGRTASAAALQQQQQRTVVHDDFELFLNTYRDQLDRQTTYTLIASHGQTELLLHFASICDDHERVIAHYLQHGEPQRALQTLTQLKLTGPEADRVAQLYYKFSPPLMLHVPHQLVDAWLQTPPDTLDPRRLLPALMRCYDGQPQQQQQQPQAAMGAMGAAAGVVVDEAKMSGEAVRYLQHCVHTLGVTDPALHNYLLSLYARRAHADPTPLLRFISQPEERRYFDPKYALRVCTEHGQTRACVRLYAMLGLFEEAVELALESGDLDEAKAHADLVDQRSSLLAADAGADSLLGGVGAAGGGSDDETLQLRKKLWLKIARHLVEKEKDIKRAMQLLGGGGGGGQHRGGAEAQQAPGAAGQQQQDDEGVASGGGGGAAGLIKIEDILPFFPEFTRIDDFKQEICASLEDYNRHLEQLKAEMDAATRSAELIRQDIADLRNKYGYVEASQRCGLCRVSAVLSRDFYLFPCEHAFHADCLRTEMLRHLPAAQCHRVAHLTAQLDALVGNAGGSASDPALGVGRNKRGPTNASEAPTAAAGSSVQSRIETLKDELDEIIAHECPLCGSAMINSISRPFVAKNDPEAHLWSL